MNYLALALVPILTVPCAACSGGSALPVVTHQVNSCVLRGVTYVNTYAEDAGDCGGLPEQTFSVSDAGTVTITGLQNPSCISDDNSACTEDYTACVIVDGAGNTRTITSHISWQFTGVSASGDYSVVLTDGGSMCLGVYAVTTVLQGA